MTRSPRLVLVAVVLAALTLPACGSRQTTPAPKAAGTRVLARHQAAPRLLDLRIRSAALGATVTVRLMTPTGWTPGSRRRWPVLYLLHGCCDDHRSWTRFTRIEQLPALKRTLVVMPDGGDVGFYSDWLGTGGRRGPAWETFHLGELRRILERDYGAGGRRAIAGLSMGGLGAMTYAARHRGLFSAAASFSGLLHPLGTPDFMTGLFSAFTPDPDAIWGDPVRDRRVWAAHDPTELVAGLRGTRLFVSAGDGRPGPLDASGRPRDPIEATVLRQTRAFVARAARRAVPARVDLYGPGTHSWPYWERELRRALPTLQGTA